MRIKTTSKPFPFCTGYLSLIHYQNYLSHAQYASINKVIQKRMSQEAYLKYMY